MAQKILDWLAGKLRSRIEGIVWDALQAPTAAKTMAQALTSTPTIWGDPARIVTGKNVLLVNTLLNANSGRIEIGDNSFFGHNVSLITGTHPIEARGDGRHSFPLEGRDIIIGKGVWIATNAVVLGPCTIGDNAVIAAGAVVIGGDIPPNTVYGGVPAKFIKTLGGEHEEHRAMDA